MGKHSESAKSKLMISNNSKNLFLFTLSYPYKIGAEKSFIQHELKFLTQNFNITIVPLLNTDVKENIEEPVLVEEELAEFLKRSKENIIIQLFRSLSCSWFYKEFFNTPLLLFQPYRILSLIAYHNKAIIIFNWIKLYFDKRNFWTKKIIFYTYWFNEVTTAVSWISYKRNNFSVLTRAHGIDLFEEKLSLKYFPYRKLTIASINAICLVSKNAHIYLSNKYPSFIKKFLVYGLGTKDPGFLTSKSRDNILRIISCSSIIAIKRVELILEGLIELAEAHKGMIQWNHIGDGNLKQTILEKINTLQINNLKCNLLGYLENEDVLNYYKINPVDIFITTTSTEGGRPVSVQEAQSFGIPVIATAVGGLPEIVNDRNGVLLPDNPTANDISQAIINIIKNPQNMDIMRINARKSWEQNCNADINFPLFVDYLNSL